MIILIFVTWNKAAQLADVLVHRVAAVTLLAADANITFFIIVSA